MAGANPFDTVQQLAGGYCAARCLHVVAELGVADMLGDAVRTAAELANDCACNADALGRVLRLLASQGIFAARDGGYCHSPASRLLRTDHPQSMRAFARMFGLPINWKICEEMAHSVRTGVPATTTVPQVIHDWADEEALRIPGAVRRSAPACAKVFLLEAMIGDHPGPEWARMLDIHMLVLPGGRQRTRQEYTRLLAGTGFELRRELDTGAGISILEADAI